MERRTIRSRRRGFLALLIALVLVAGLLPVHVLAATLKPEDVSGRVDPEDVIYVDPDRYVITNIIYYPYRTDDPLVYGNSGEYNWESEVGTYAHLHTFISYSADWNDYGGGFAYWYATCETIGDDELEIRMDPVFYAVAEAPEPAGGLVYDGTPQPLLIPGDASDSGTVYSLEKIINKILTIHVFKIFHSIV